ncbi:MAG TPA: hypothetical protein VI299_18290 [Polyangiales bacterium]
MRKFKHPWLNDSEYPVLQVTFPQGYSYEQTEAMFNDVQSFYAQNSAPFAWVVDATRVSVADAKARKLTAEHEARSKEHLRRFNAGTAFVIESAWVRGIVTAIYWISPPAYPYEVFADVAYARAWARERVSSRVGTSSARSA